MGYSRKSYGHKPRKNSHSTVGGSKEERRMIEGLDELQEFESFKERIYPKLRRMVLENWDTEKIRKAFAPMIQARMVQGALTGKLNSSVTQRYMKDVLDRQEGTAVQRVDNVTRYARMDKRELAALALQKLRDAGIIDVTGRVLKEVEPDVEE